MARLIGVGLAFYLRLVARTCRVSGVVTRQQVILAFWHEYNMAAFVVARKVRGELPHASFSTQGFRGAVVTSQFRHSGTPVEALPLPAENNRVAGAAFALRLSRLAVAGSSPIITPDGPFGPAHVAKPGALIVARESGLPIQPWAFAIRPAIRLTGRWDHQLLPLPFCRIRVFAGDRIHVGARMRLKPRLAELQASLDGLTITAESR